MMLTLVRHDEKAVSVGVLLEDARVVETVDLLAA